MDCDFFALALSLAIIFIFFFMYQFYYYRDRYLLFWSLGCLLQMSGYYLGFRYNFITPRVYAASIILLSWTLLILTSFFQVWGTILFVEKKRPRWFFAVFTAGLAIAVLYSFLFPCPSLRIMLELYSASGTFVTGVMILLFLRIKDRIQYFTGAWLIMWGLCFPGLSLYEYISREVPVTTFLSPWRYLVNAIIGSFAVVGLLAAYIRKKAALGVLQDDVIQQMAQEIRERIKSIHHHTQLIINGDYGKGPLEKNIGLLDYEVGELETLVRNLMLYNKAEYLSAHRGDQRTFELSELIKRSAECLRWKNTKIVWRLELNPLYLRGDEEQWRIVIENILNSLWRCAKSAIAISLEKSNKGSGYLLRVSRDGPRIKAETAAVLSGPSKKAIRNENELSMFIIRKILAVQQAGIWLENKEDSVVYSLEIMNAWEENT